jgi:hypothetical protein
MAAPLHPIVDRELKIMGLTGDGFSAVRDLALIKTDRVVGATPLLFSLSLFFQKQLLLRTILRSVCF